MLKLKGFVVTPGTLSFATQGHGGRSCPVAAPGAPSPPHTQEGRTSAPPAFPPCSRSGLPFALSVPRLHAVPAGGGHEPVCIVCRPRPTRVQGLVCTGGHPYRPCSPENYTLKGSRNLGCGNGAAGALECVRRLRGAPLRLRARGLRPKRARFVNLLRPVLCTRCAVGLRASLWLMAPRLGWASFGSSSHGPCRPIVTSLVWACSLKGAGNWWVRGRWLACVL